MRSATRENLVFFDGYHPTRKRAWCLVTYSSIAILPLNPGETERRRPTTINSNRGSNTIPLSLGGEHQAPHRQHILLDGMKGRAQIDYP